MENLPHLEKLINLMPGYISVVDLQGNYLAFNENLKQLMKVENPQGMIAGEKCQSHFNQVKTLISSPIGTKINWEYYFRGVCLAVSSIRNESYILNQAVDITEQKETQKKLKESEERNQILLKSLPAAVNSPFDRRKNNDLDTLINILTETPLVSQNINESLIKLEVELRQNSSRLTNLEKMMYLDENAVKDRINQLEIQQVHDQKNWQQFEQDKEEFQQIFHLIKQLCNLPGGFKTWLGIFLIFQISITFLIEKTIFSLNFQNLIEQTINSE